MKTARVKDDESGMTVVRLLFRIETSKKVVRKFRANCCSSWGAHLGLRRHCIALIGRAEDGHQNYSGNSVVVVGDASSLTERSHPPLPRFSQGRG